MIRIFTGLIRWSVELLLVPELVSPESVDGGQVDESVRYGTDP